MNRNYFSHSGVSVVTVRATGTATFNPNNQFEALDAGETASEQFSYTVGDGSGDTAVGTVTVLIHGVTDPRDLGLSYGSPQLPGIVLVGDAVTVNIGISNLSTQDVSAGTLAISIPTAMTVGDTGFCIAQPNSVQCNFGPLAAGATINASFSLTLDAPAIGLREIDFALSGNEPNVTMANNAGSLSADVRPVAIFADAFED